jgi:hypothetical protein
MENSDSKLVRTREIDCYSFAFRRNLCDFYSSKLRLSQDRLLDNEKHALKSAMDGWAGSDIVFILEQAYERCKS